MQGALNMCTPGSNPIVGGIAVFVAFSVWLAITFAVLLGMDVLECFLHTVRLHWVEYCSKFFRGDGELFAPYRHQTLLKKKVE